MPNDNLKADTVETNPANQPLSFGMRIALGIAAVIAVVGFLGPDRWFYEHVSLFLNNGNPATPDFYHHTHVFWNITRVIPHFIGSLIAYFALVALHRRGWRAANALALTMVTTGVLARVAELGLGRIRPNLADSHLAFRLPFSTHDGVCLPSGEAVTAFALAFVLSRFWPKGRFVFYGAALLAAVPRFLFGMHYISDVAIGAVAGVLMAHVLLPRFSSLVDQWMDRPGHRSSEATDTPPST